ncbi:Carboxypeptidase regulatory-like domain protein [uncultured archaeon]|nr:Carboxypeptidase regulatory-like domain protein [uncultured archaeon]
MRGYDDNNNTKMYVAVALVGGLIAGFGFNGMIAAFFSGSQQINVINIPDSIGAGKITDVRFITLSGNSLLGNVNITLSGAAAGHGITDENGMLVFSVNATTNGSIGVTASKSGYTNATSSIQSIAGLDVSASPSSITSGTATFITFMVNSMGKPVTGTSVNVSGAGITLEGITGSNGQVIIQINAPNTGRINATARKAGYADGSTSVTSVSQQVLGVSSSQNTLTVNVPVYVTFTVTAGGTPVADAGISLSGAATGDGITNPDGKAIILVTPQTTGTITASASKIGFAGGSGTITSTGSQSLSVSVSPSSITALTPAFVTFTVKSGNNFISESTVTLTGAASGNGVTNQNGIAIIQVNTTGAGTITATASRMGYTAGSTTFSAAGQQTMSVSASPANITNGVATFVTFTVKSGSNAVSGATVSVSGGGITADGMTNSAGQATMQLTASGTGAINVAAHKDGYSDVQMTLAH